MQHRVVADRQAVGFTDGDAVQPGIHQHVIGDHHILVIHPGSRAAPHRFVAHEDPLGRGPGPDVENIAPYRDIRARAGRAAGKELDHVGVIERSRCLAEIMDIIFLDHDAADIREPHAIGPQIAQFVSGNQDLVRPGDRHAFPEPRNRIVLDDDAGIGPHDKAEARTIAVIRSRQAAGVIAVKGRIADRDVIAVGKNERSGGNPVPGLEGIIEADPVKGQVGRTDHIGRRKHRRIGSAG